MFQPTSETTFPEESLDLVWMAPTKANSIPSSHIDIMWLWSNEDLILIWAHLYINFLYYNHIISCLLLCWDSQCIFRLHSFEPSPGLGEKRYSMAKWKLTALSSHFLLHSHQPIFICVHSSKWHYVELFIWSQWYCLIMVEEICITNVNRHFFCIYIT